MGHNQYTFTIVRHWDQLDHKKSHYNQGCARLVPRLVDGFDACCRFILCHFGIKPKYKPKCNKKPRLVHYFVYSILHFRALLFVHFYPLAPTVL